MRIRRQRRPLTHPFSLGRAMAPVRLAGAVAFALIGASACTSSSSGTTGAVRPNANVITADEIAKVSAQNAYEVVQKLRPAMLRHRGLASANAQSRGEVLVYVDNSRLGAVDTLRQITPSSIAAVRYFSASEAQLKWGSGHPGGVIEILTKR